MPYYEYEIILEEIKVIQKEQEKENKRQEEESSRMQKAFNPNSMMSSMNRGVPNMSLPKVNIPRF